MSSPTRAQQAPRSPCVNVCRMDAATALCEGCLRTIEEITAWSSLDESARLTVLRRLPARRTAWREARLAAEPDAGRQPGGTS